MKTIREIGSLIGKLSASIGSDSFPQVSLKDNVYCKMLKGIPIWQIYIVCRTNTRTCIIYTEVV